MENNEFKKVRAKSSTSCYFEAIIKLEHFIFNNTLTDEKSHEYIFIYDIV